MSSLPRNPALVIFLPDICYNIPIEALALELIEFGLLIVFSLFFTPVYSRNIFIPWNEKRCFMITNLPV